MDKKRTYLIAYCWLLLYPGLAILMCILPSMEQPEYSLLQRERVEKEYLSLYKKYGLGITSWSPLASGVLTGKYNEGIPPQSRLARETWLRKSDLEERITTVKKLSQIAKELDCTVAQLALAWCLKNPNVSSVIMGASNQAQLQENLRAVIVKSKLRPDVMKIIENISAGR